MVLPVGISFFTFKTMSYTIDVYRGTLAPAANLWRLHDVRVVLSRSSSPGRSCARRSSCRRCRGRFGCHGATRAGLQLILLGVTKKLLVADRLAVFVDPVFASPGPVFGGTVATAVVAYSLQIYCDFSGYTDIAIGVAKIIGFDLPENFNMPYLAPSITEFWRRWHITLSQWLRDYLYIPLGGNRRGTVRGPTST